MRSSDWSSDVCSSDLAADSNTVSGKKTAGLIVDELWLFGKMANAEDMLREAAGGLASRPEGFVVDLTTQSNETPQGAIGSAPGRSREWTEGEFVGVVGPSKKNTLQ